MTQNLTPIDYVANGENDEYDPQYDLVDREENTKAMLMYFGLSLAFLIVEIISYVSVRAR